ncbi:MAG: rod shape-determining protein MreC [Alphaproteobacteria bacterium]|nr:MAG: rod shape-determining protein MreC [Alphaproteobacteria bacterium]
MALSRNGAPDAARPVRRVLVVLAAVALLALAVLWRIEGPRAERIRAGITDALAPAVGWVTGPIRWLGDLGEALRSWSALQAENRELRAELQRLRGWRETALELEARYARLLELNRVRLSPGLTWVTAEVLADSGSPFRQSVLINVGREDGIRNGWAVVDGLGLVGRIAGVGRRTARVLLITDPASRVPVTIAPSGQRALAVGDNGPAPMLELIERADVISAGDRVATTGDASVFPPGVLVGHVVRDSTGTLRVRPAADLGRLDFLRVLRWTPPERPQGTGGLVPEPEPGAVPSEPEAQHE